MNKIRAWREFKGMTLQDVSDRMEKPASPGTLSSYESGARRPSQARLDDIAQAIGVARGKLLDEEPPSSPIVPQKQVAEVINLLERMEKRERELAIELLGKLARSDEGKSTA